MCGITDIYISFTVFKITLRTYHLQTQVYARHKASDKLHSLLSEKFDRFLETLIGANRGKRFSVGRSIDVVDINDRTIIKAMDQFKSWLVEDLPFCIESVLGKQSSDLLNIRDEILGDINRSIYLFTLM